MNVKMNLPLLPLRDIVVFPSMVIPLFVGRDKSINALNNVMTSDKKILLVTQKNSEIDDPKKTDVFMYGCEGNILQLLKLPDGTVKVLVEGAIKAMSGNIDSTEGCGLDMDGKVNNNCDGKGACVNILEEGGTKEIKGDYCPFDGLCVCSNKVTSRKDRVIVNKLIKDNIQNKIISDNLNKVKKAKNIEVLTISNLVGEAIKRISNSTSVSDLFK